MSDIVTAADRDFTPIVNLVEELGEKLKAMKQIEKQTKEAKDKLFEAMLEANVKTLDAGRFKITLVEGEEPHIETEKKFNESNFKMAEPELYELYSETKQVQKKGRKGYVKVTIRD